MSMHTEPDWNEDAGLDGPDGSQGNDDKGSDAASTELTALGEKLPDSIKESGKIRVGSDIEYPPIEFFKEGTDEVQGLDYDLGQAIGKKLGVKVEFINDTDFGNLITSLKNGRYDIVMSAMNDTEERRGNGADFIDYFSAGTSMLVQKGNPKNITSFDSLCGQTIAVQKGTVQETDVLPPQIEKCKQANNPIKEVLSFEKDTDAVQQVKNGRAVANLQDYPVAGYTAKTSGGGNDFEVVGEQVDVGQYGIAVPSTQTALRDAIRDALKAVIDDGTYDQILAKWNISGGALKTAAVNGAA